MNKTKVIIISNPVSNTNKSSITSLNKFINIVSKFYKQIYIIAGNVNIDDFENKTIRIIKNNRNRSSNKIYNFLLFICFQIKTGIDTLLYVNKNIDVYFWIADGMLIPYIIAKILGAKIHYFIYGNPLKIKTHNNSEYNTYKRIIFFANHSKYVCAENSKVFDEWEGKIKNYNRKIIHLYADNLKVTNIKEHKIGMLCRIADGKYVYESIIAFQEFIKDFPEWKLEIVGNGPLKNICENYINKNKLNTNITLYGWQDFNNKIQIMKKWYYLLFPTDTEGLPNSILESMGMGIPCIASPVSSITDIITDEINGFYIKENSIEQIKCALYNAIKLINTYEQISINAYNCILDNYTLEKSIKDFSKTICL